MWGKNPLMMELFKVSLDKTEWGNQWIVYNIDLVKKELFYLGIAKLEDDAILYCFMHKNCKYFDHGKPGAIYHMEQWLIELGFNNAEIARVITNHVKMSVEALHKENKRERDSRKELTGSSPDGTT